MLTSILSAVVLALGTLNAPVVPATAAANCCECCPGCADCATCPCCTPSCCTK